MSTIFSKKPLVKIITGGRLLEAGPHDRFVGIAFFVDSTGCGEWEALDLASFAMQSNS